MKKLASTKQHGFSLVELMIALVLGLILIGGVINIFVANRQAFRTSENLARVQENARTAFDLLSRDLREAGGNPCGNRTIVNVINNPPNLWWANWVLGGPLRGFDNSAAGDAADAIAPVGINAGNRWATSDAILLMSGNVNEAVPVATHVAPQFTVNTAAHGISGGDILFVCDYSSGTIFQATNAAGVPIAGTAIFHNAAGAPGNSTTNLGPGGAVKPFASGSMISRYHAAFWYIGCNGRIACNDISGSGRSLYSVSMDGTPAPVANEIVEGVRDMQIQYLSRDTGTQVLDGDYVDGTAGNVPDWSVASVRQVVSVRVTLNLVSRETVGTDQLVLNRQFLSVINLRNRETL